MRYQNRYVWLLLVSALDLILTMLVLYMWDGYEVNPVAAAVIKHVGFVGAIPLLVRLGLEIKAGEKTAPFVLIEVGPGIGFGQGSSDVTLAARLWAGVTFWSVRGK